VSTSTTSGALESNACIQ